MACSCLEVAVTTPNKTLQVGVWKYFCEADCHFAYQTKREQFASTLGPEGKPAFAHGEFVIVRVKTWFDERTIASFRGDSPLTPGPRTVQVVDDAGYRYLPWEKAAEQLGAPSTPINEPLRPGESYETNFVFDIPFEANNLRLLIADADPFRGRSSTMKTVVCTERSIYRWRMLQPRQPPERTNSIAYIRLRRKPAFTICPDIWTHRVVYTSGAANGNDGTSAALGS